MENNEFHASELIEALQAEGLTATVYQSGGNTATFELKAEGKEAFLIGPGRYDWNNPGRSEFTTDELYYGPDSYDVEGNLKDSDPPSHTVEPGTPIQAAARQIAEEYRKFAA